MKKTSFRVAYLGILGALAVALSFLEGLLPPLPFLPPGAKAGFSNLITMYTASRMGLAPTLCLCLVKSLFVLLTRGITAFCMSIAGGLVSAFIMWLCFRFKNSLLVSGILGAIAHNAAQLLVAMAVTQTPALIYYAPLLLVFAIAAGSVTGLLLRAVYSPLCRVEKALSPKGE